MDDGCAHSRYMFVILTTPNNKMPAPNTNHPSTWLFPHWFKYGRGDVVKFTQPGERYGRIYVVILMHPEGGYLLSGDPPSATDYDVSADEIALEPIYLTKS